MPKSTPKKQSSKLPLGPQVTHDKHGTPLYWLNRKRVKKDTYWAEIDLIRQKQIAERTVAADALNDRISAQACMEKLDALITDVRQLLRPTITATERRLLALIALHQGEHTGYSTALSVCNDNPMSANALIGSLQRKGLIRYESRAEARYRLIETEYTIPSPLLTSSTVQDARQIDLTKLGADLARSALDSDLAIS